MSSPASRTMFFSVPIVLFWNASTDVLRQIIALVAARSVNEERLRKAWARENLNGKQKGINMPELKEPPKNIKNSSNATRCPARRGKSSPWQTRRVRWMKKTRGLSSCPSVPCARVRCMPAFAKPWASPTRLSSKSSALSPVPVFRACHRPLQCFRGWRRNKQKLLLSKAFFYLRAAWRK